MGTRQDPQTARQHGKGRLGLASGANSNRGGFSLIELLVVFAILIALMGLLFPVVSRAKEHARRVACANNLRQLVTAVQMYAQDWGSVPVAPQGARLLGGRLEPYGAVGDVLVCPSDPGNPPNLQPGPCGMGGDTSYLYQAQPHRCEEMGIHGRLNLDPSSPVFLCVWHRTTLGTYSVARYDGSVKFERALPEPRLVRAR